MTFDPAFVSHEYIFSQILSHTVLPHYTHLEKKVLEQLQRRRMLVRDRDSLTSSRTVKCPLDQQPSRLCLDTILSSQQPEAKLKVFFSLMIKWAETLTHYEQNSIICRTIYNRQSFRIFGEWLSMSCIHLLFIKAVRPVGWGMGLMLRDWLLGVFSPHIVKRWLGWKTKG